MRPSCFILISLAALAPAQDLQRPPGNDDRADKTISSPKQVRGDLSGYMATNTKELDALKRLAERNYFQFTLLKKDKQPTRVGDIFLRLKSVDRATNKFTLLILVDDRMMEKKDKTINESQQFYGAKGGKQPYELVVNEVGEGQVTGYLAVPRPPANDDRADKTISSPKQVRGDLSGYPRQDPSRPI
jgi:hypothetical protein